MNKFITFGLSSYNSFLSPLFIVRRDLSECNFYFLVSFLETTKCSTFVYFQDTINMKTLD